MCQENIKLSGGMSIPYIVVITTSRKHLHRSKYVHFFFYFVSLSFLSSFPFFLSILQTRKWAYQQHHRYNTTARVSISSMLKCEFFPSFSPILCFYARTLWAPISLLSTTIVRSISDLWSKYVSFFSFFLYFSFPSFVHFKRGMNVTNIVDINRDLIHH